MLKTKKVFEKVFSSVYWRYIVVVLLLIMVYSLFEIFRVVSFLHGFYSTRPGADAIAEHLNDVFNWGVLSAVLLVMIIVAGVIDLVSYIRVAKRFRAISTVINNIAGGDLEQRITITSKDEIGLLAQNFNSMADTIADNIKRLKETDNLRRELVANVAHDLGGPVTSIQGYVETILMKEGGLGQNERRKFLQVILENAKSLAKMVAELFDLSKFDAENVIPQKEYFSIVTLASDIASRFQPHADNKKINITVEAGSKIPLVYADLSLIERVLSNIIDNALSYTGSDGSIDISFQEIDGLVWTKVTDSGVGIARENLPHVFDRFYRVDKDRSRTTGGAGLGLSIVKNIIAAHRSLVLMDSCLGKGTTVSFSLHTQETV